MSKKYDELTKIIEELPIEIKKYEDFLNKAFENLRFLRSQLFLFENKLRDAYNVGNLANEKVAKA